MEPALRDWAQRRSRMGRW